MRLRGTGPARWLALIRGAAASRTGGPGGGAALRRGVAAVAASSSEAWSASSRRRNFVAVAGSSSTLDIYGRHRRVVRLNAPSWRGVSSGTNEVSGAS